jgi:hypothetical protein
LCLFAANLSFSFFSIRVYLRPSACPVKFMLMRSEAHFTGAANYSFSFTLFLPLQFLRLFAANPKKTTQ